METDLELPGGVHLVFEALFRLDVDGSESRLGYANGSAEVGPVLAVQSRPPYHVEGQGASLGAAAIGM